MSKGAVKRGREGGRVAFYLCCDGKRDGKRDGKHYMPYKRGKINNAAALIRIEKARCAREKLAARLNPLARRFVVRRRRARARLAVMLQPLVRDRLHWWKIQRTRLAIVIQPLVRAYNYRRPLRMLKKAPLRSCLEKHRVGLPRQVQIRLPPESAPVQRRAATITCAADLQYATQYVWIEGLPRKYWISVVCRSFEAKGFPVPTAWGHPHRALLKFKSRDIAIAAFSQSRSYACPALGITDLKAFWLTDEECASMDGL